MDRVGHNLLRGRMLLSLLARVQLGHQQPMAHAEAGHTQPGRLHGLLLLLPVVFRHCTNPEHLVPVPSGVQLT